MTIRDAQQEEQDSEFEKQQIHIYLSSQVGFSYISKSSWLNNLFQFHEKSIAISENVSFA